MIRKYSLSNKYVLVTSHYEDHEIQREAMALGARIVPKFLIESIPLIKGEAARSPVKKYEGSKLLSFDLVLIDDDSLVHETWKFCAQASGKRAKVAYSLDDIDLDCFDPRTPFFVDKNLGDQNGFKVAETLWKQGFQCISLTTGEDRNRSQAPHFIQEIRGKDFPNEVVV